MPTPAAAAIVAEALALRRSHPQVPVVDVLDLVMKGRHGPALDFGPDGLPPAEFALIVAEAFDSGMTPGEWRAWTGSGADPKLREGMLAIWRSEVWPRFVDRFALPAA